MVRQQRTLKPVSNYSYKTEQNILDLGRSRIYFTHTLISGRWKPGLSYAFSKYVIPNFLLRSCACASLVPIRLAKMMSSSIRAPNVTVSKVKSIFGISRVGRCGLWRISGGWGATGGLGAISMSCAEAKDLVSPMRDWLRLLRLSTDLKRRIYFLLKYSFYRRVSIK